MNPVTTRALLFLPLCAVGLSGPGARAQGILDLFGPDRPERAAPPPALTPLREAPRAEKEKKRAEPAAAKSKKKGDAARQPDASAKPGAAPGVPGGPGAAAPPPPYEGQLVRLSEVLGALAFLRDLCPEKGVKDGADWRAKMSALLEAEAPGGPRRDKYVAAFNRGFRGYELTYRACTANARNATARYLDEAAKISRDVTYRFGSP
jgi:uncharacterized protein (TIGR02301 family)